MIELKHRGTGSWLDPRSNGRLSAALSNRLWERCRGHRGLVLTLTYDRTPYDSPLDLYRKQSEERHVRAFIRKLGNHLNDSLSGRWFCKMEFQKGGWVHFHLIMVDVGRIPHAKLAELWGHGFVSVKRLTPKAVRYCTKYLAKGEDIPAFLFNERPRSIKIIRVSPGFWARHQVRPKVEPSEPDPLDEPPPMRVNGYIPIGQKIDDRWDSFTLRDEEGKWRHGTCDLGQLLAALLMMGCGVVGRRHGWLLIDGDMDDVQDAILIVQHSMRIREEREPASGEGQGPRRRRRLDLINSSNPHTRLPNWLRRLLLDDAEVARGGAA
ncbi:MAG: hypothetical protein AAFQ17_01165 [Pseudomonadota bacterium]